MELWHAFDRIRAALVKQESLRGTPGFGEWVVKALPLFAKYCAVVDAEEDDCYGHVLCEWGNWLEARKLSYRGRLQWEIPTKGPLIFTPPSSDGLMRKAGEVIRELGLEDAIRRSARSSPVPTSETRGARGRKMARSLTVRKS